VLGGTLWQGGGRLCARELPWSLERRTLLPGEVVKCMSGTAAFRQVMHAKVRGAPASALRLSGVVASVMLQYQLHGPNQPGLFPCTHSDRDRGTLTCIWRVRSGSSCCAGGAAARRGRRPRKWLQAAATAAVIYCAWVSIAWAPRPLLCRSPRGCRDAAYLWWLAGAGRTAPAVVGERAELRGVDAGRITAARPPRTHAAPQSRNGHSERRPRPSASD